MCTCLNGGLGGLVGIRDCGREDKNGSNREKTAALRATSPSNSLAKWLLPSSPIPKILTHQLTIELTSNHPHIGEKSDEHPPAGLRRDTQQPRNTREEASGRYPQPPDLMPSGPQISQLVRCPLESDSQLCLLPPSVDTEKIFLGAVRLQASSSPTSRDASWHSVRPCSLATRVKATPSFRFPPIELPGSLLLPSQGFPPPPATPSKLIRRATDESTSLPSLTTCKTTSSESSATMGIWKHRHAPCGSPELEDLRPASTQSDAMSSVNSAISKPFNLMTIDELLEALPECNPAAVQEIWMPEMRKKFEATRAIVQNAEGRNFQSHESLVSMETVCTRLSQAATKLIRSCRISRTSTRKPRMFQLCMRKLSSPPSAWPR